MSDRIEQAARVLFEGAAYGTWDDAEDWQKAIYRGHAHDLAKAGLLATHEEWSAAYYGVAADGTRTLNPIGTEGTREHAEATRDDCAKDDPGTRFFLARRGYAEWERI